MRADAILLAAMMSLVSVAAAQSQQQPLATQTASAGQESAQSGDAGAEAATTDQRRPPLPDMMNTFEFVTQEWR